MKKENDLLNILKFFFSMCVVCIHTAFLSDVNEKLYFIWNAFINTMAVPFFFVASGYYFSPKKERLVSIVELVKKMPIKIDLNNFLIRKLPCVKDIIVPYKIVKIIPPFIVWSAIAVTISQGFSLSTLKSLLYGYFEPLSSPGAAMWFLKVLGISMYIIWLIKDESVQHNVGVIWCVLFIIGVAISSYEGWMNKIFVGRQILSLYYSRYNSVRNFLFSGFLVYVGYFIGKKGIPNILKGYKSILIFLLSISISIIERIVIEVAHSEDGNGFQYYFITPILASSLLCISLQYNIDSGISTKSIRKYSTGIYYMHMTFASIYSVAFPYYSVAKFSFVFGMSLLCSIIAYNSDKKLVKTLIC